MSYDEAFLAQLARALADVGLDALVVGSIAGSLQGATIVTQDVDLLIRDTVKNRQKLVKLAERLNTHVPVAVSELSKALTFPELEPQVDILFDALSGGLTFASLKARHVQIKVGTAALKVVSLADCIRAKEAANRPKDLAQLPNLKAVLALNLKK